MLKGELSSQIGLLCSQTAGSGRPCQLEVPEQINTTIELFLSVAYPVVLAA